MPRYNLVEVQPKVPEGISCRYFAVDPAQAGRRIVLVVAFEGEYPDGSLGNAHGRYIARMTLQGVQAFDADGLVLDFRGLTYRWGNTLLKVFQDVSQFMDGDSLEPGELPFPIVVATSERSGPAFLSLVTPTGKPAPDWHFQDMDAAVAYLLEKIQARFDF